MRVGFDVVIWAVLLDSAASVLGDQVDGWLADVGRTAGAHVVCTVSILDFW